MMANWLICVRQRKPYLGFVFTDNKHKDALMKFVSDKVFTAFQKVVGDALHDPNNIKDVIKGGKGDGAEDALQDNGDDDPVGDDASQKAPTTTKNPRRPTKKKPEPSGQTKKKPAGGSGGIKKADLLQKLKEMNDAGDTDLDDEDDEDNADEEEEECDDDE